MIIIVIVVELNKAKLRYNGTKHRKIRKDRLCS